MEQNGLLSYRDGCYYRMPSEKEYVNCQSMQNSEPLKQIHVDNTGLFHLYICIYTYVWLLAFILARIYACMYILFSMRVCVCVRLCPYIIV